MKQSTSEMSRPTQQDAIAILTEDHQNVEKLFKQFEKLMKAESDEGKVELVQSICNELTIHAQIEEEIFYPALRSALSDQQV